MASYPTVSKLSCVRNTAQLEHTILPNTEVTEGLKEQLERLFQELLENSQAKLSLNGTLLKLRDICQRLVPEQISSYSFLLIVKHYVRLLDNDNFFRAITHDDSNANRSFLRKFFQTIQLCNILEKIKQTPFLTMRKIYFFLLNQIHYSTRLISYLQNNLPHNENDHRAGISSCAFIINVVLFLSINLKIHLTNTDLDENQDTLWILFLKFTDRYFLQKGNHRVDEDQRGILIERVLCFMTKLTAPISNVPVFLNLNYPQACLRWLSLVHLKALEYSYIIDVLYHIARHDRGTVLLQKLQCGKIVRQFRDQTFNTNIDFLSDKGLRCMTRQVLNVLIGIIVDPDELYEEEVDRGTISQIFLAAQNASQDMNYRYETYPIEMFFMALMKLCTNDRVIHYILKQHQCAVFFFITLNRLLLYIESKQTSDTDRRFAGRATVALMNILWSLSFHQQYKERFFQDIPLLLKAEKYRDNAIFQNFDISHQMSSLKRSIDGIWQNLYLPVPINTNLILKKSSYSVMISYSQMNLDFCQQLCHVFSTLPELVVTTDSMNNKHLWKDVAQLIEQSDVILFLISRDFYYSKSCRQEFIYGTGICKKLFFPVFIDSDFKANDWLHQGIARLKCVRFGQTNFLDTCEELVTLINENLPTKISSMKSSSNFNRWTAEEVKRWFIENDLLSELCDFYQFQNGKDLSIYHQALKGCPWKKEYERIEQKFGQKFQRNERLTWQEFEKFIRALERLNKSNC